MMINRERDKFLTEAMGECWHNKKEIFSKPDPQSFNGGKIETHYRCGICKMLWKQQNNFSTWEGFGMLWEWAIDQKWWDVLYYFLFSTGSAEMKEFIHPDRFANAVYDYLQEVDDD